MTQYLQGGLSATLHKPSHFPPDEAQEGRMHCGTGCLWLQFSDNPQWYRVDRYHSHYMARIWLDACVTMADVHEALGLEPWPPKLPTKEGPS